MLAGGYVHAAAADELAYILKATEPTMSETDIQARIQECRQLAQLAQMSDDDFFTQLQKECNGHLQKALQEAFSDTYLSLIHI